MRWSGERDDENEEVNGTGQVEEDTGWLWRCVVRKGVRSDVRVVGCGGVDLIKWTPTILWTPVHKTIHSRFSAREYMTKRQDQMERGSLASQLFSSMPFLEVETFLFYESIRLPLASSSHDTSSFTKHVSTRAMVSRWSHTSSRWRRLRRRRHRN